MRPSINHPITIRRTTPQVTAFHLRLSGHRGANTDLDPGPLPLAHPTEHRHHQIMSLGFRINHSPDLRNPQLYLVVDKDRKSEPVLVAVKRPLRFPDHYRIKSPSRILQRVK